MKKLVFIVTGVLLVMVVLSVGCAPKAAPPAAPPAAPAPTTENITGAFKGVTPAAPGANATVTVQPAQGPPLTLPLAPGATLAFEGKFCTLEDLEKYEAANVSYNCTIVYDDMLGAVAVYVGK